jgi:DNA-binding CsgD family transcriptional regulator
MRKYVQRFLVRYGRRYHRIMADQALRAELSAAVQAALQIGLHFASVPALVVREGVVIHANQWADDLLAQRQFLFIENGVLMTRRQHEAEAMAAILADLRQDGVTSSERRKLILTNRQMQPIMLLTFQPLDVPGIGNHVLLRIADLHVRPVLDPGQLIELFGLTRGEARVAAALFTEPSIAAIAEQLQLAPETVRSHLKRVMSKLGVNSQAHLIGFLTNTLAATAGKIVNNR